MKMNRLIPRCLAGLLTGAMIAGLAGCSSSTETTETASNGAPAAEITEILIPGMRIFPESMTATTDGTLIIGSIGLGSIFRAAPGQAMAEQWIAPKTAGIGTVLGVLADEVSNTLWVCSNNLDGTQLEPTALKALDLKTTELKGTYPLAGEMPLCNDIAVRDDGTAFVADTRGAKVLMLNPGGTALAVSASDPQLNGVDGLAFGSNPNQLIVNNVSAHKLYRLDLDAAGKTTKITELMPSRELMQPDGMRALGNDRFLLAEGAGRMSLVTVSGDKAEIQTLKELPNNTPAVASARGMAWVVEGKLPYYMDEKLKGQDPGEFKIYGVPLP